MTNQADHTEPQTPQTPQTIITLQQWRSHKGVELYVYEPVDTVLERIEHVDGERNPMVGFLAIIDGGVSRIITKATNIVVIEPSQDARVKS